MLLFLFFFPLLLAIGFSKAGCVNALMSCDSESGLLIFGDLLLDVKCFNEGQALFPTQGLMQKQTNLSEIIKI